MKTTLLHSPKRSQLRHGSFLFALVATSAWFALSTTTRALALGRNSISRYVLALLLGVALVGSSSQLLAADNVSVDLVRLDYSNCINSDVACIAAANPDLVDGFINVHREQDGNLLITVHLNHGTPQTTYAFYLKCIEFVGYLYTNPQGVGNAIFTVPSGTVGPVFAFDMYPPGAPLGNKYQSVQVYLPQ